MLFSWCLEGFTDSCQRIIGSFTKLGNICSSSERHVSFACSTDTLAFLTSNHCAAMCLSVFACSRSFLSSFSSRYSLGSISLANNYLAALRLLRALAIDTSG